jgi:DMSO/TMAO reductase YedYZ molybdopterin-dependent catalytic subunit
VSPRFPSPEVLSSLARRDFLRAAGVGTVITALGGATWVLAADDDPRTKQKRADGRPRLPPGQRLLGSMKPMGGDPGDPDTSAFRFKVSGEVESPFELDFAALLALPQTDLVCDVHCVTGWSAFDVKWKGVLWSEIAKKAKLKSSAKHAVFEAANGYTTNVPLKEALAPGAALVHQLEGKAIPRKHGPPARGLVPELYFWKSAKWITGVRFVAKDEPGFWETRGYHNHADPWTEERYG